MTAAALRWIRVLGGLVIAVFCLWLALKHVQFGALSSAVRNLDWTWLIAACAALTAGYIARIHRWWWMLRLCNPAIQWRACVWPLLCGFAVNNVVPFRAGDALRVVGFQNSLQTPAMAILGSLVVERLLDVTILLAFFLVGMVDLRGTGVNLIYLRTAVLVASVGAIIWLVLLLVGRQAEAFLTRLCRGRLLGKWRLGPAVERSIQQLFKALSIVRLPGAAARLLLISSVVWICEGGVFAAVAASAHFAGRMFGPWFALAAGSLATMIPSSPGYVGTFDFFTSSGFSAYGMARTDAVAAALIVHAVLWLPLTGIGLGYLALASVRSRRNELVARPIRPEE